MTALSFGRGRKDRVREPLALPQAGWHLLTRQAVRVLIFRPRAARKVSANHAFEIDALGLADDHEATAQVLAMIFERRREVGDPPGDKMVLLEGVGLRAPEEGQLREDLAAVRDSL